MDEILICVQTNWASFSRCVYSNQNLLFINDRIKFPLFPLPT